MATQWPIIPYYHFISTVVDTLDSCLIAIIPHLLIFTFKNKLRQTIALLEIFTWPAFIFTTNLQENDSSNPGH